MKKNYFDDLAQATMANTTAINNFSNAFNKFSNATISISDDDIIDDYNVYACAEMNPSTTINSTNIGTITINPDGLWVNNSAVATTDKIDTLEERIEELEAAIHRLEDPFDLDNWNFDFDFDINFDFEDTFKWLT